MGEVGLNLGESPCSNQGKIVFSEAAKHGFTEAVVPKANCPKKPILKA